MCDTVTVSNTEQYTHTSSVVRHVPGRGTELGISLDDFVHCIQEVLLRGNLRVGQRDQGR